MSELDWLLVCLLILILSFILGYLYGKLHTRNFYMRYPEFLQLELLKEKEYNVREEERASTTSAG